jgi:LAO/AO transport system kinase
MAMRRQLTTEMYVNGVRAGDRATIARAITLIESDAAHHRPQAQEVLSALLPFSGHSMRIGITGVPGVGKSSFIETLGVRLGEAGRQIAVLAVDPSSSRTHGSILGDKTRMERLSRMPNAYIRPSPTGGALGGVARKTRESMLVCEAAGFEIMLVETVGVGQSETTVRAMTDCFVLLALAGAGDELQAIKKGVVELADLVVLTKADGENRTHAEAARADYLRALRYIAPATVGWQTHVLACSAHTGDGIDRVWQSIEQFFAQGHERGTLLTRRRSQTEEWMQSLIAEELTRRFYTNPAIAARMPELRAAVAAGQIPVTHAVETLLSLI